MSRPIMVNIQGLFDDPKCFQTIRDMRWPDGVACPSRGSTSVVKNGRDDPQPDTGGTNVGAVAGGSTTWTAFIGQHLPLRAWIACLYLMGLNSRASVEMRPGVGRPHPSATRK